MHTLPPRPIPARRLRRRPPGQSGARRVVGRVLAGLVERVRWVGAARIATGSVAVIAVVAGGWWLVRPPALPTEASLPYAVGSTSVPDAVVPGAITAAVDPGSSESANGIVTVHVAGAVRSPGVYSLPAGSRAIDGVQAAGGMSADADPDRVNLAAVLSDGQRLYVPKAGEADPLGASPANVDGTSLPVGPIDLNTATAEELETLPGVGPATAAAIVAYRDRHGPFASVDELGEVSGIGPSKLAAIRDLVTV